MSDLKRLKEYLMREYGIASEKDLEKAMVSMSRINIGVFVAPVDRKVDSNDRTQLLPA